MKGTIAFVAVPGNSIGEGYSSGMENGCKERLGTDE
jgi:hypothetical protein